MALSASRVGPGLANSWDWASKIVSIGCDLEDEVSCDVPLPPPHPPTTTAAAAMLKAHTAAAGLSARAGRRNRLRMSARVRVNRMARSAPENGQGAAGRRSIPL
jgi:hypothetical protein